MAERPEGGTSGDPEVRRLDRHDLLLRFGTRHPEKVMDVVDVKVPCPERSDPRPDRARVVRTTLDIGSRASAILVGYVADLVFGDPERFHPVAGFGRVASTAERLVYRPTRRRGIVYAAVLVGSVTLAAHRVVRRTSSTAVLAVFTWVALGGRSLKTEARVIGELIATGDHASARRALPSLVGRDPSNLDDAGLCRAVVESVAENTSDAIVGPLFWGAIAGPVGVIAVRAANTLDAMVGHRNPRYERFGWAAARFDDAMCWPVARLASLPTMTLWPSISIPTAWPR